MYAEVVAVDANAGRGELAADDGRRLPFLAAACRGPLRLGQKVEFREVDGVVTEIRKLSAVARGYGLAPSVAEEADEVEKREPAAPIDWPRLFWSPQGRIPRDQFWIGWGLLVVANLLLSLLPIVGAFAGLLLFWPNSVLQTKRLHDMGRSGWLQLAPYGIILLIGLAAAAALGGQFITGSFQPSVSSLGSGAGAIAGGLMSLVFLGYMGWVGFTPSQPGSNRYGRNPRRTAETTAETFA
jgi:uncharacterized membrane protein YhaH (DUF805 family)